MLIPGFSVRFSLHTGEQSLTEGLLSPLYEHSKTHHDVLQTQLLTHRLVMEFYENGTPKKVLLIDAHGNLLAQVEYKQGQKDGFARYYYSKQKGQKGEKLCLKLEVPYVEDQLHGEQKSYYPSGKIQGQEHYCHGLLHGVQRRWDENGQLIFFLEWKDGIKNGRIEKYDAQGKQRFRGQYQNNKLLK